MSTGNRIYIAAVSAFIIAFGNGRFFGGLENAFFPAQAVCFEEETEIGELTVIKGDGEIEISFRIAEIIRDIFE